MRAGAKLLLCILLVVSVCFSMTVSASAKEAENAIESGSAVNCGLEAEILTEKTKNNSLAVQIKLTNTNAYEVSGVGYKLSASDNGKLSGKTTGKNITIAPDGSFTADAELKAAKKVVTDDDSPDTGDGFNFAFWLIILAASVAVMVYMAADKKRLRQSLSFLLVFVMLFGIFGTAGISAAAADSVDMAADSFAITKDVTVDGKEVRLTLEVTVPDENPEDSGNFTVKFVDSDKKLVKLFSVPEGKTIDPSEVPVLTVTGKSFDGWFLSDDATERFYADEPVEKDLTVYPGYSALSTDEYTGISYHNAGIVERTHNVVISSQKEITTANLGDFAELEARFGEKPAITVTSLGNNLYNLSGIYDSKGTYCWKLLDDSITFDGLESGVREYGFVIIGEETETYEYADDLNDIEDSDFISLKETDGENISLLTILGASYSVGDKLGVKEDDDGGDTVYYKVIEVVSSDLDSESGKTSWILKVTPCAIEEVYDEIDVNKHNVEADEIIDLSNSEDIENYISQIEDSEEIRVYADYIASAINDSPSFQKAVSQSYGKPAFIGYISDSMITARGESSTDNASAAIDEALELVNGVDISRPGVNVSISASAPVVKTNTFNSYWDKRYAEVGEIDPDTGKRVNVGKTNYFGKKFASIETDISVSFSLNGGTKNIIVEAKLMLKQYVKVCSATQVKLEKGWQIYKGSEINAGATAYSDTSVDFTVTLKTDNGGFDISEEIDDIISAAKGEKYESDNQYIKRFRNLYDGSERDFIEVYRKNFCSFKFSVGPVEVNIPIAFVVRFGLSAGVGIGYDYRTTYTVGVYKEKNSKELTPYCSPGEPGWEFNFYVAGHAGVKLALNARLSITITGCSKLFEIGLEAELGIRADFYGYYLLKIEKNWRESGTVKSSGGAYYFNTKIYFNLKLFASAFTFEKKWNLFSWEKSIYSSGNRYVLLDFEKRHDEQSETIIIPITKDADFTEIKDGRVTYDTLMFDIESYFKALKPVFFDLQKSNEVLSNSKTTELLNKYTTITTGSCLTIKDGVHTGIASAVGMNISIFLRPSVLEAFLTEKKQEYDTYITLTYNGPMFAFGDDRPSVTYKIKLVSEKYLTGERYDVNFWVDGNLYKTKQYIEGTSISPWEYKVPKDYYTSLGLTNARFDIPTEKVTRDMDLYANVTYEANNNVYYYQKEMTAEGITDAEGFYHRRMSKNSEVEQMLPSPGILQPYFLGWDLEGDGSDELNVPIPGQNSTYKYHAVYSELPTYKVTVIDGNSSDVLIDSEVTLGDFADLTSLAAPDDGLYYNTSITSESGSYLCNTWEITTESKLYPTSDITLVWNCDLEKYNMTFCLDYSGTVGYTQVVDCGDTVTDPVGSDNWSQLDYHTEEGSYYKFIGWEIWSEEDGCYVDALTKPVIGNGKYYYGYIYAKYQFLGVYKDVTLLAEDGETVLYSGTAAKGLPFSSLYHAVKNPDKENTYKMYWVSAEDESVVTTVEKSGSYILRWEKTARKYTIAFDDESAALSDGSVTFESGIAYGDLSSYINGRLGSFVPEKPDTDYNTYSFDGVEIFCQANPNGEYGICTVSFKFNALPKKCSVTYKVTDSSGKTGKMMSGQTEVELESGAYSYDFTIYETNNSFDLHYTVVPQDSNYNFIGWAYDGKTYLTTDEFAAVGHDAVTFTAVYERKPCEITFDANGGVYDGELKLYRNANERITLPTLSKQQDAQYSYSFIGWEDEDGDCFTENFYFVENSVTLKAKFNKTIRSYYITFNAGEGVFSNSSDALVILCEYGKVPSPEIPTKAATATQKFIFDGWTPTISSVTGAAEYTAKWKASNLFTLTFDAGNGSFDANGTAQKTYVVEDGASFDTATVPTPSYNYNGKIKRFLGWSGETGSFTVTANKTLTAEWSEPVSALGILISDGVNTEDVAAYLANSYKVLGYSVEYITGDSETEPFFALKVTGSGLTLSGSGSIEYTEISNTEVTLDGLNLTGNISVFGNCELKVKGTVTLNSDENIAVEVVEPMPDSGITEAGALALTGADADSELILNSTGGGGIRSFDGAITISGLSMDLTSADVIDPVTNDVFIPVALGSMDSDTAIYINNSTVKIQKGYLSGKLEITNSSIEFADNEFNGLECGVFNDDEAPVQPDSIVSLENSHILFKGTAYVYISYEQPYGENPFYSSFFKQDGEDSEGFQIVGRFLTTEEFNNALAGSEGSWMLAIDDTSSVTIEG